MSWAECGRTISVGQTFGRARQTSKVPTACLWGVPFSNKGPIHTRPYFVFVSWIDWPIHETKTKYCLVRIGPKSHFFSCVVMLLASLQLFIICFTQTTSHAPERAMKDSEEDILGEVMAELDDITFFLAACYRGRADLSYLCLQSRKASVYHAPQVQRSVHSTLESAFCGAELQSTLYPTEPGITQGQGEPAEPMVAIAVKVSMDADTNVKVRQGVGGATSCHFPDLNGAWLIVGSLKKG